MDFNHTEDRRMLADTLSRFLRDTYPIEKRLEIAETDAGYSDEVWGQMAELGILGALFGEEVGGFGGAAFDVAVVFEELGKALVVEPVLANLMAGTVLAEIGSDAQKAMIEEIVGGAKKLTLAHYEPTSRYEASEVSAHLSDGKIHGTKTAVLNGGTSDGILVTVRTGGDLWDEDGISVYLVDPKGEGVSIREVPGIDGTRVAEVVLTGATGELVGPEGGAFPALEKALAIGCVALCAEAVGAMTVARDMTLDYLKQRKQFGVIIGRFQVLQHRMADVFMEMEQATSALINAAGRFDQDRVVREKNVSAAKNTIGRVGKLVAEEAIQMHGGIAMTWEYAVGHYAKRITMIDHQLGDADYHLERYMELGSAA
ncbi:acyl-CoA dehydrogenase family protein [Rhodovulum sp. DZ06]|uniref:acyl-CoA dehydrogenase family protein n=1 Tax=Rhodovulum sp. DZ06 TaxID=3425126 RepID=UPI003D33582D